MRGLYLELNTHELAWAAGLFDGEGSCVLGTSKYTRKDGTVRKNIVLAIGQSGETLPEVLERFQLAVNGVGTINGPYHHDQKKYPNKRPTWFYRAIGFNQTQTVVALLWRWLGSVKRLQATRAIKTFLAQSNRRKKSEAGLE